MGKAAPGQAVLGALWLGAVLWVTLLGPTAHLCDAVGVAGLVGRNRSELPDEEGTVALDVDETGVAMEVVEGVVSFRGAGWAGVRFTLDGFKVLELCTVAVERSNRHVVDHLEPEARRAHVIRGDRVETAPTRHQGSEGWVLARPTGSRSTAVGRLDRDDLGGATRWRVRAGDAPPQCAISPARCRPSRLPSATRVREGGRPQASGTTEQSQT
jgi:hypothetical protein